MPELPEVETVRTALELALTGRKLAALIHCVDALRHPLDAAALAASTEGRVVGCVRRRGKYLICEFDDTRPEALLLHLGMTGSFRMADDPVELGRHDRLAWRLAAGNVWIFTDPRRFGAVSSTRLEHPGADPPELRDMGPEPLSERFDGACLAKVFHGRRQSVKPLLLDQRVVAGIGNIYASEALYQAGINPRRAAGRISRRRLDALAGTIKSVLREAIACGGTTIRDFQSLDGNEGRFRICLAVYGRAGRPCPRCGEAHPVRRIVQGGRSTYLCPRCQR